MEGNGAREARTPRDNYPQLSQRCGGAKVDVKDENRNLFRRANCVVDGKSDKEIRTMKDRRNYALIMEDLKRTSPNEPLVYVSITSGNSGYSLGRIAQEISEETGREITVVNIVSPGIPPEIKRMLEDCSIVVVKDLENKINFNEMRGIAVDEIGKKGWSIPAYEQIHSVERIELVEGYRQIVIELAEQGPVPDYIFCPVGEGELLVEIAEQAELSFPDKTPKIVGVTVNDNIIAHLDQQQEDSFIVISNERDQPGDKLVSGYSKLLGQIRNLQAEGVVEIITVEDVEMYRAWEAAGNLGINSEPSAAVAFAGAFRYKAKLNHENNIVIINSGRGIYDEEGAKRSLESKCNKDRIDWQGKNGIMRAIDRNDMELVKTLTKGAYEAKIKLRQLAEQGIKNVFSETVWHTPGEDPNETVVKKRSPHYEEYQEGVRQICHKNEDGENTVVMALKNGRIDIADFLFELVLRPEQPGEDGEERFSAYDIVNDHDKTGKTLLHHAIERQEWEFAIKILKTGFGIIDLIMLDVADNNGDTPLHAACRAKNGGAEPVIKRLMEREFDATAKNDKREWPLFLAATWASDETISMLVKAGQLRYDRELSLHKKLTSSTNPEEIESAIRSGASRSKPYSVNTKSLLQILKNCGIKPASIAPEVENAVRILLREGVLKEYTDMQMLKLIKGELRVGHYPLAILLIEARPRLITAYTREEIFKMIKDMEKFDIFGETMDDMEIEMLYYDYD